MKLGSTHPVRATALKKYLLVRAGAFLAGVGLTSVAFLDFCDLAYRCGCRAAWAGAAEACNVHHAVGPHCPWCSYGFLGSAVPFAAIVLVQGAVAFWPGERSSLVRLFSLLAAFPVVGGATALLFGLLAGYWAG